MNRVRDVDEKVRKTAVTSICEIAADYSDAIPKPAIEEAELRLRDKKVSIILGRVCLFPFYPLTSLAGNKT